MRSRSEQEKRERGHAAGRLAIDMLLDTWNLFAVGDDKRRWAGGLSTLEVIGDFLRLHKLIDENGQQTDKAKRGEHLVLDRPDEIAQLRTERDGLSKALQFYADEDNYDQEPDYIEPGSVPGKPVGVNWHEGSTEPEYWDWVPDKGKTAREALTDTQAQKGEE